MSNNTTNEFELPEPLPEPWNAAVDAVLNDQPPPFDADAMIRQVIPKPKPRIHSRWRMRATITAAIAASILLLATLALFPTQDAWAQVSEAVSQVGWLRMKSIHADPNQPSTVHWYNGSEGIEASRSPGRFEYMETSKKQCHRFDSSTNAVYTLPLRTSIPGATLSAIRGGFFEGDLKVGSVFQGYVITEVTLKDNGDDRLLSFSAKDANWSSAKLMLRGELTIQRKTNLPTTLMLERWNELRPDKDRRSLTYAIDYPEMGPADIYELGVPADVKMVSRLPSKGLEEALAEMRKGRENFGDYSACICQQPGVPKYVIRAHGNRVRLDQCLPAEDQPDDWREDPADWSSNETTELMSDYWLRPILICDGSQIMELAEVEIFEPWVLVQEDLERYALEQDEIPDWYKSENRKQASNGGPGVILNVPMEVKLEVFGPRKLLGVEYQPTSRRNKEGDRDWASHFWPLYRMLPENLSYPSVGISPNFETLLRAASPEEPSGSLVIDLIGIDVPSMKNPMFGRAKVCIDPERTSVCLADEYKDCSIHDEPKDLLAPFNRRNFGRVFTGHKKSPSGFWYPTKVKYEGLTNRDDGSAAELLFTYQLDFDAKADDSVFQLPEFEQDRKTGRWKKVVK